MSAIAYAAPDVPLSKEDAEWLRHHPVLTVGAYKEGYPPFEELRDGQLEGLGPDYLHEIAGELGVTLQTRVYATWPQLLAALARGEIDVATSVTPLEQGMPGIRVGATYFESLPALVQRIDTPIIHRTSELAGKRLAVHAGYFDMAALRRELPDTTLVEVGSTAEALQRVRMGEVTAYIDNPYSAREFVARLGMEHELHVGDPLALPISALALAVPSTEAPLGRAIDHALSELTAADHGRLRAPWVGRDIAPRPRQYAIPLSEREKAWLHDLPPLRLGVDPSYAPFSLITGQGQAEGLALDYVREIAAELGLRITQVPSENWSGTVASVERGEVDLVAAINPQSATWPYLEPSTSYLDFPIMIVTREGAPVIAGRDDLSGKRVLGNTTREPIRRLLARIPGVTVVPVGTEEDGLRRLAAGEGDAFVGNLASVDYLIREHFLGQLKVAAPTGDSEAIAIGVRRDLAPLLPLINRVLVNLPTHRQQEIRNTWFASHYVVGPTWREIASRILPFMAVLLASLIAISYAYLNLRRETRRRERTERRLAEVTAHVPAVVYEAVRDTAGQYSMTYVGGDPQTLLGMEPGELMASGDDLLAPVAPEDREALHDAFERSAKATAPLHVTVRAQVGERVRYLSSDAVPLAAADGSVRWNGYWVDVTAQELASRGMAKARDEAEAATRAKSDFLATISHEIRTPMNGVIGLLDVLERTPLDGEQRRMVATIEHSAEALMHILDDVLDFSKIEAGHLALDPRPSDPRALVEDAVAIMAAQAEAKGLAIAAHFDDALAPAVLVDDGRLRQVLLNLIGNAIKFTAVGHVDVDVHVDQEHGGRQRMRFVVSDTGIGIHAAKLRHVFAPFSQAESSTTRRFGGTGLGLSISRRLIERMGGHIVIQSEPGHGTVVTATVELPIADPLAITQAAPPAAPADAAIPARAARILVAEDHPVNQQLVQAQLAMHGWTCTIVDDGEAALEALAAADYDLLLVDCHMPRVDGYAVAREVRRREEGTGRHLPIVAMTADARADQRERCEEAGMDDLLRKPLRLDAFREAVARWLAVSAVPVGHVSAFDVPIADMFATGDAVAPPSLIDMERMRRAFGSDENIATVISAGVGATREALSRFDEVMASGDAEAVAGWIHHVLGGVNVFGESAVAREGEALELALREGAPLDAEAVRRFAAGVDDFTTKLATTPL
ncbi:transporter substrate-binding domain-containing protein [Luteibacter aegosomaticola]|uniref:ATP-binding protein n=1 Tax=Luteibacter aegosomaticola TaxID=2911538 RepID=UPI001FFAE4A5|nr:transporter substrate-binding domain-containing protein [Luteibacter aegosomaticola]UPG91799.1 transporter substrate-binding domain-containing protein [Luteibacter aegosomaticola]